MKKILVTGCAGFIGSNFVDYLLALSYQVVGIDNFNNEIYPGKIKRENIKDALRNPNFKLYELDLIKFDEVNKVFQEEKFDAVVHLAAFAGVTHSYEYPLKYVENNEMVTTGLITSCLKNNVHNFLFASTSSVYGKNPTPFLEEFNTDHPLAPYPASKKASEVMLSAFSQNYDLNVSIFRFFNPLDIRIRPDLALSKLVRSALFGEEFPQYQDLNTTGRDYCYLQDMFVAMENAIKNPLKYEIFNLGNSSPVTLGKLVETVERVTEKKVNLVRMPERKGEMTLTYSDITKARSMLGYEPKTTIEQIVRKYYSWFLEQPEWYKKGDY
jgi:UDP-glucuronate 4-epimerase